MHYASVVDWRWKENTIRANPSFHNRPRYDYALVQVTPNDNKHLFVQLIRSFKVRYLGQTFSLALVLPFDVPCLQRNRGRDDALRLIRLRPRQRVRSIVIDANTIVRGGLLTPDLDSNGGEHLVIDVIDEDMWRRLKTVELVTNARI